MTIVVYECRRHTWKPDVIEHIFNIVCILILCSINLYRLWFSILGVFVVFWLQWTTKRFNNVIFAFWFIDYFTKPITALFLCSTYVISDIFIDTINFLKNFYTDTTIIIIIIYYCYYYYLFYFVLLYFIQRLNYLIHLRGLQVCYTLISKSKCQSALINCV